MVARNPQAVSVPGQDGKAGDAYSGLAEDRWLFYGDAIYVAAPLIFPAECEAAIEEKMRQHEECRPATEAMVRQGGDDAWTLPSLTKDQALRCWLTLDDRQARLCDSAEARRVFYQTGEAIRCLLSHGPLYAVDGQNTPIRKKHWREKRPETWHRQECAKGWNSPKVAFTINEDQLRQALASSPAVLPAEPPRRRPGRKCTFDHSAHAEAYTARVDEKGSPDQMNDEGWRCQADVARWLQVLSKRDGREMSWDTAKRASKRLMADRGA